MRDWWSKEVRQWLRYGADGVWITRSEPIGNEKGAALPLDTRFNGESHLTDLRETHNIYPNLFAKATREGFKRAAPDKRPFLASRAGFTGIHRTSVVWTGEVPSTWSHLREVPATLLNLSLSGVGMVGSTMGGATRINDPELYVRWVELACWTPLLRQGAPASIETTLPWALGENVEAAVRKSLKNRYRMTPYWYSLLHEYARSGLPPMRALVLDKTFVTDPNVRNMDQEWMVGPFILVAPVLDRGTRTRTVYLPQGKWTEIQSERIYDGPVRVTVDAPLESTPLFARAGSILPSWPDQNSLTGAAPDTLIIDLYPPAAGKASRFRHVSDDGITIDGAQSITIFGLEEKTSGQLSLKLKRVDSGNFIPRETHLLLRFHHQPSMPRQVVYVAGNDAETRLVFTERSVMPFGWTYHEEQDWVEVLVPQQNDNMTVTLLDH
jgi:alpha-glucosidase